jgi:hypothetical protein
MNWDREDIDLAFIREFSTGGNNVSMPMSTETRRERIRLEIYRNARAELPFYDSGMTYAQAYEKRYHKKLEQRACLREGPGRPAPEVIAELEDDDPADTTEGEF